MKVTQGLAKTGQLFERSVLTIGNFDGFHRGHGQIVTTAREYADRDGLPVVALTFEPHPLSIVRPDNPPRRLTLPEQKLACLSSAGVDAVVVARSCRELLGIGSQEFLRDIVVAQFNPRHIVEGWNFGFGRGRGGNVETLQELAAEYGFEVHVVNPIQQSMHDGSSLRVSSSLIREFLSDGRVELAAEALGRLYELRAEVVGGYKRGRSLGYPTANLAIGDQLVPADGVYSGVGLVGGRRYRAAISIGDLPTYDGSRRQVEAFLLDFEGDLYGETIGIQLRRRLRDQLACGSEAELIRRIEGDVEQVRRDPL